MEFFNQNWLSTLIGLIGVVLGMWGLVAAYRSRQRPQIAAEIKTALVINQPTMHPSDVEILFRGHKVPRVMMSHVTIWNYGNITIDGKDIVKGDPLRIIIPNANDILEVSILKTTREVNDFRAKVRPEFYGEVICVFEYLDPEDGAVIKILHTGDKEVNVEGTIRGCKKGILTLYDLESRRKSKSFPARFFTFFKFFAISILLLTSIGGVGILFVFPSNWKYSLSMFFIAFLYIWVLWDMRRKVPKNLSL